VLEVEGYAVWTAQNGREGRVVLEKVPRPCSILLDLMMPVMNGMEFLAALKENDLLITIPDVLMTAYDRMAGQLTGHVGIAKKPIDLDYLLRVIKQVCYK